ncbi:MAG TPA: protease modulator HflC [Candidatus Omnitrophota bacterium]|nr:protease modulator HflC [Candidatus Omnitrophota bacterium]
MKNILSLFVGVVILLAVLGASGAFYTVDETQQVIVTQFGKLVGPPRTQAGLYFKLPFIQTANYFDKRVLEWNGDADQMPTREKRLIWVDTTARWRIGDVLKFMQRVGTEPNAQTRLDDIIDAKTRETISSHALVEAIRSSNRLLEEEENADAMEKTLDDFGETALARIEKGREALSAMILSRAAEAVKDYGIDLIDVKIKRINYVSEVQQKVYERMISERKRAAEQFRSEGQGKKAEIEGQMVKELDLIQSEAYRKAQEIKGKADAQAIQIYADAYNNDPEFYSFIKTLEAYRKTMDGKTMLMLSTDNDFYGYLKGVPKPQ